YGALPVVHHALTGMSAVGAGLLLTSGVRMATGLPRQWRPWLFAGLAFVGVGVLRWSLLGVMGGGGFGNPLERPAEQVLRDVTSGYVSVEAARRGYGVVINAVGRHCALDIAATEALRRAMIGKGGSGGCG